MKKLSVNTNIKFSKIFRFFKYYRNKKIKIERSVLFLGNYGIKVIESGIINLKQIEAARKVIARVIKGRGKLWICIFPYLPITKKPLEVRMGKGHGNIAMYVCPVKKGKIIFEVKITGLTSQASMTLLQSAAKKIPLKSKVITL